MSHDLHDERQEQDTSQRPGDERAQVVNDNDGGGDMPESAPDAADMPVIAECRYNEGTLRLDEHYLSWYDGDKLVKKVPLYAITGIRGGGMFGGGLEFGFMTDDQTGKPTNKWIAEKLLTRDVDVPQYGNRWTYLDDGGGMYKLSKKYKLYLSSNTEKLQMMYSDDSKVKPEWFQIRISKMKFTGAADKDGASVLRALLERYAFVQRDRDGCSPFFVAIRGADNAMIVWDHDTPDARGSPQPAPAPQYLPPTAAGAKRGYHRMLILKEGYSPLKIDKKFRAEQGMLLGHFIDVSGKLKRGEMPADMASMLAGMRAQMTPYAGGAERDGVDSADISIVRGDGGLDILTPDRAHLIHHIPYYKFTYVNVAPKYLEMYWICGAGADNGDKFNKEDMITPLGTMGGQTIREHSGNAAREMLCRDYNPGGHGAEYVNHEYVAAGAGMDVYKRIYGDKFDKRHHPGHALYQKPVGDDAWGAGGSDPGAAGAGAGTGGPQDMTISREDIANNFARFNPFDFEHVIADLFRARGYEIEGEVGVGTDRGVDVLAVSGGKRTVIQVKKYQGNVGGPDINKTLGAMAAAEADNCLVISTGSFTEQALSIASRAPGIELWDGERTRKEFELTYFGAGAAGRAAAGGAEPVPNQAAAAADDAPSAVEKHRRMYESLSPDDRRKYDYDREFDDLCYNALCTGFDVDEPKYRINEDGKDSGVAPEDVRRSQIQISWASQRANVFREMMMPEIEKDPEMADAVTNYNGWRGRQEHIQNDENTSSKARKQIEERLAKAEKIHKEVEEWNPGAGPKKKGFGRGVYHGLDAKSAMYRETCGTCGTRCDRTYYCDGCNVALCSHNCFAVVDLVNGSYCHDCAED